MKYQLSSVPDEGYSRNISCALHWISTFLLISLCRYLCWWTISPRGYHPPSSLCLGTDMVYLCCYYYHGVDTSVGEVLVSEGIIRPVVCAWELTWYIYVFITTTVSIPLLVKYQSPRVSSAPQSVLTISSRVYHPPSSLC